MMKKSKENSTIDRRQFIRKSLAGSGGVILAPTILSSCAKGANDRILIAHIGVGSRGTSILKTYFLPLEDSLSVAVSDAYLDRRTDRSGLIKAHYGDKGITAPECEVYLNFEEILARDDIDAVVMAMPDHWHVPGALKAARAGKHIYLEKPLGLSYPHYLKLQKELKARDLRFHYGTQQRVSMHMKMGIEMIAEGAIGEIEKAEVWCPPINPVESPVCPEAVPVPDTFDYDRWTGPAPVRPYCPDRVTNNSSWFINDYSIGFLAGWGAHPLDILVWALKDEIEGRYTCEGEGGFWAPGGLYNNVNSWDLNYTFREGINMRFFSTDVAEAKNLLTYRTNEEYNGTTFYGSKGWISLSRGSANASDPDIDKKLNDNIRDYIGMGEVFIDMVKGETGEVCPISDAIISDSISHVGNMAVRTGRMITWDTDQGKAIDDDVANSLFVREMREPYFV
jgi:predicted dehydrogenase